MRHNVITKTFSRDTEHRRSMMRNLAASLVEHEAIVTTVAKAKYLRPYIEKIVTRALKGDLSAVRQSIIDLGSDSAARKLVKELAPKFATRPGGYTRIIKLASRDGDKAPLARIEFMKEVQKAKEEKSSKETKISKAAKVVKSTKPENKKKIVSKTEVQVKAQVEETK
ncbi:50S ribosomal protein L17 [candidate division WWE3 bacterium]|nr:50S ribosomal protein L17 [candidate division WWE3 bacterium]